MPGKDAALRENIYLHLNKTIFYPGESLWFAAYVQDQFSKSVSLSTKNLHVALSDSQGKVVSKKIFSVENGVAQGDFELDTTFTASAYNLTAWTNYMRNFENLKPFQQRIKLLRESFDQGIEGHLESTKIIAYPEGGSLIADTYNQVAIRLMNAQGRGIPQNRMYLINSSGTLLRSDIATDECGFGRIGLIIDKDEEYILRLAGPDGLNVDQVLPSAEIGELGVQVDNKFDKAVLVRLTGSEQLIAQKNGQQYTIGIFQDDDLLLENIIIGKGELSIAIDRNAMPYGVNTVVLLNEDLEPIAHRLFFNKRESSSRILPSLRTIHSMEGDSLRLKIELPKDVNREAILSVSALPLGTYAYNPSNDITTSFVINPYLKNSPEFGLGYFGKDWNRQEWFQLDTRLVMEGNGSYTWDSRALNEEKNQYVLENGFLVTGSIAKTYSNEAKKVYLKTNQIGQHILEDLKKDKTFSVKMNLMAGDSLGVLALGSDGKPIKSKLVINMEEKSVAIPAPYVKQRNSRQQESREIITNPIFFTSKDGNVIKLDEAVIKAKIKNRKKVDLGPFMVANFIDDRDVKLTPTIRSYIMRYGIVPVYTPNGDLLLRKRFAPGHPRPFFSIFLDGMSVMANEVMPIPMATVRVITVQQDLNSGLFIEIELRKGDYIAPEERARYVRFLIKEGYSRSRPYTEPGYIDYDSDYFKYYGVLDWEANIFVSSIEPTVLKIPTHGQDAMLLFIEGICADGSLISFKKEIQINENR